MQKMISNTFYFATIRGSFINYLNLFSENGPIRLKNTTQEKESIIYTKQDIFILKKLHPEIEITPKYQYNEEISPYTRRAD